MVKHDIDYRYIRPGKFKVVSEWAIPLVAFFAALSFYISRMAPSILWGDLTDFSTANYIFSPDAAVIYPLYSLISRVVLLIPGITPAFSTNLMSAFFGAVSVTLFYLLIKRLFQVPVMHWNYRNMPSYQKLLEDNPDYKQIDEIIDIERIAKPSLTELPSLGAAVLFAFTLPVWLASVRADVYSLQLALTMAGLYFVIEGIQAERNRIFFLGLWLYALSLTNHPMLALAFAPAFIFLILVNFGNLGNRLGSLAAIVLMLAAAACVYFYLPVHRAFTVMSASSGGQGGLTSTIPFLSGFTDGPNPELWPMYLERLKGIINALGAYLEWPLVGMAVIGLAGVFQLSKRVFTFLFLGLLFNLLFAVWFDDFYGSGFNRITLMAPLMALTLITAVSGLMYIVRTQILAGKTSVYMALVLTVFIFAKVNDNWERGNLAVTEGPEIIGRAIIDQLPKNSLLVTADKNLIQPLWYYAYIEGDHHDLCIVSSEELNDINNRRMIKSRFPGLKYPENFLVDDSAYNNFFAADLCWRNSRDRRVYLQYGVYGLDYRNVVPQGLLFRYIGLDSNRTYPSPDYRNHTALIDEVVEKSSRDSHTMEVSGRWLYYTGLYYDNIGSKKEAWYLYSRALSIDMTDTEMRLRMAGSLASSGKYADALKHISEALAIEPKNPRVLELGRRITERMNKKGEVAAKE